MVLTEQSFRQFQLYLPYVLLLLLLQSQFDEDLLKLFVAVINNKLLEAVVLGGRKGNTHKTVSPALPTKDTPTPRFTPYETPHAPFRLDGGPHTSSQDRQRPLQTLKGWLMSQQTKEICTDVAALTGGDFESVEKGRQFVPTPP